MFLSSLSQVTNNGFITEDYCRGASEEGRTCGKVESERDA
jgi:hypothetical protein